MIPLVFWDTAVKTSDQKRWIREALLNLTAAALSSSSGRTIKAPILQLGWWRAPWAAGEKVGGWFASESKQTEVNSYGFLQLPVFPRDCVHVCFLKSSFY